jgi:HD-GYP domain-containing protein (c-di-GMP phosphodiesterase class II)
MHKKIAYISIDKEHLDIGSKPDFDIFEADNTKTHMNIHLQSGSVVDSQTRENLANIERLYVMRDDLPKYETYVKEHIKKAHDGVISDVQSRAIEIYTNATKVVDEMFSNPDTLENVKSVESVVDNLVDTILHDEFAIESLLELIAHDYYTHTHSINVSIYALSLGTFLKMDKQELTELGESAIMHDLGKSKIDSSIINKPGKLTDDEFEEIKKHPLYGYQIAKNLGVRNENILSGIRHHHEKLDGRGYPDGISEEKISRFARIIAVCDIFDALSTRRSYKEPLNTFDTLMLMKKNMPHHLDMNILNEFIKMFKHKEGK